MSDYKKYEKEFINYAHRGASEYLPENTLLSFYTGVYMKANFARKSSKTTILSV